MGRLAYKTAGNPNAPCVIFLHGFLGSKDDWDGIIPNLSKEFHCVAVDLPGHGETPIHEDETFPTTATEIIELADGLDAPTFAIVGYSMGGRLALYMATHYSMRVDTAVIESASPGIESDKERQGRQRWETEQAAAIENAAKFTDWLQDWYDQPLFKTIAQNNVLLEEMISRRAENDPKQMAAVMRLLGAGRQEPLWAELREHHLPMLFVAGEEDPKYPALMTQMAELADHAELTVIKNAGHNVHLEHPVNYATIIKEFLQKHFKP